MINNVDQLKKNRNIYLIGFMGVGKSTVARKTAYKLNMNFIDSDRAIEELAGKSINDIFKDDGEQHFRLLERQFIEFGHPTTGCVVACGGGLPIADGIIDLLKGQGIVFALFANSHTILERTNRRQNRPLLKVENREECITNLLADRVDIYQKADYLIYSENRRIEDVVADIIRIYKSRQK